MLQSRQLRPDVLTCPRLITAWCQSRGQNHDLVDLRATCPFFPMPMAPVEAGVSAEPASLPGRHLPPGFPRAAKCCFCGPPDPRICGPTVQPLRRARPPPPCQLGGLRARESQELEQDTVFRGAHCGGGGVQPDTEGANKRTLWGPETEGGLGSVQSHGAGVGAPAWRCLFPTCVTCASERDARLWKELSVREIRIPDPVLLVCPRGVLLGAVRPLPLVLPGRLEPETTGAVSNPVRCVCRLDVFIAWTLLRSFLRLLL